MSDRAVSDTKILNDDNIRPYMERASLNYEPETGSEGMWIFIAFTNAPILLLPRLINISICFKCLGHFRTTGASGVEDWDPSALFSSWKKNTCSCRYFECDIAAMCASHRFKRNKTAPLGKKSCERVKIWASGPPISIKKARFGMRVVVERH